jgi:hypothetical protein
MELRQWSEQLKRGDITPFAQGKDSETRRKHAALMRDTIEQRLCEATDESAVNLYISRYSYDWK